MQLFFQQINLEYFIIPIVGAIIGYTTNWLAIKMIFRPYKAKYIFGLKIPFTPGVIAKERERISKNIGETIEKNVLTKEDLNKFLEQAEIGKNVDDLITSYMKSNEHLTLQNFILEKFDADISYDVKKIVMGKITEYVTSQQFELNCNSITEKILTHIKNENFVSEIKLKSQKVIEEVLSNFFDYFNSDEFLKLINEILQNSIDKMSNNDDTLEMCFESISLETKLHIKTNLSSYTEIISDYLISNKSEKFHEELKKLIEKVLKSSVNPMIVGFINLDSMYESGVNKFSQYIINENNRAEILYYIDAVLNKIFEQKISTIVNNMPTETMKKEISKSVIKTLNDEQLRNLITDKICLDEAYIESLIFDNESEIKQFTYKFAKNMVQNNLDAISEFIKSALLNFKIKNIVNEYNFKITKVKNVNNYILAGASFVVEKIEIAKIIENKLNEIEIKEIEKMILAVAQRELSYITMLGGLLGFIIASITIFI